MSTTPKIGILGAGPAGLTLANILREHNVPFFALYESDASPHERTAQGGTLDLHPRSGQLALREAGLWDAFVEKARPESDVVKVVRQDGEVLWDGNVEDVSVSRGGIGERPEIDREVLRELLLDGLRDGVGGIQWGKRVTEVIRHDDGKVDVLFKDGSVEEGFDLVIGADGAWSKARKVLTDEVPHYSGVSLVEFWALNVEEKHKWMSDYVGRGSLFSFGEGRTIQIQRNGDGSIRTYGCLMKPESFLQDCGIDWANPDTARKEYVDRYFADCGEHLKRMILESSDQLIPRVLYMLPVGFRWEPKSGVTLVGDAAHLMTPFAGVGVNAAMIDALELARVIIGYVTEGAPEKSLAKAIEMYESELFTRGEMFAQKTMKGMKGHFSANGSEDLARRLREAYGTAH